MLSVATNMTSQALETSVDVPVIGELSRQPVLLFSCKVSRLRYQ